MTTATIHAPRLQRGSTSVALLLMMLALVTMLGLVEVSYLYWAKRDTQKIADLAALAGAQQMSACGSDGQGNAAASNNALIENGFTQPLTVTCGTWDPMANSTTVDHFTAPSSGAPNAVKVVAQRSVLPIYGLAGALPQVGAKAVATAQQPMAVFSIGSTLATVDENAPLGQLLAGIGIAVPQASLVGYNGIANVTLTPSGLLKQLGVEVPADITVGGLNQLLASNVGAHALIDVLNAAVVAAGQPQLLGANTTLLGAVTSSLGTPPGPVTLGSTGTSPGLFAQIVAPDAAAQSALQAQVNLLQLISTAVGVATGKHAIAIPATALNVPGLRVSAAASVIEPPQIAIGGVGATASTAQVRLFLDVQMSSQNVPLIGGLASPLINISLNLPIAIDMVYAQATLSRLCTPGDTPPTATFNVNSAVLKTCVGGITQQAAFSTAGSCDAIPASTGSPMLSITAAGKTLAALGNPFVITGLPASGSGTLRAGDSANIPANGTPLDIGTTVNNTFSALTAALLTQTAASTTGTQASNIASPLSQDIWGANTVNSPGALYAATNGLGGFLQQTTSQLGGVLGNTLTLNVAGLLGNVGGLVNSLGGLLGGALCVLPATCQLVLQNAMAGSTGTTPNALISLLGFTLRDLQAPLDQAGSQVLTPLLTNTLGVKLGVSTVTLHSLQCHGVQLVY
ncbi:hypothetical protein CH75_18675 [Dyella jiangningensis]|nr:hypothetical protein CH75_18675 [Dyella jiangningensis]